MDLPLLTLDLCRRGFHAECLAVDVGEYVDVLIDVDGFVDPLTIQLTTVERFEGALEDLEMIQLFAAVPQEFDVATIDEISLRLAEVNSRVPLGAFGLIDEPPVIYLRHVLLLPPTADALRMVAHAIKLVHYGLDLHVAKLLQVSDTD